MFVDFASKKTIIISSAIKAAWIHCSICLMWIHQSCKLKQSAGNESSQTVEEEFFTVHFAFLLYEPGRVHIIDE